MSLYLGKWRYMFFGVLTVSWICTLRSNSEFCKLHSIFDSKFIYVVNDEYLTKYTHFQHIGASPQLTADILLLIRNHDDNGVIDRASPNHS